jgi:hypothetical protein
MNEKTILIKIKQYNKKTGECIAIDIQSSEEIILDITSQSVELAGVEGLLRIEGFFENGVFQVSCAIKPPVQKLPPIPSFVSGINPMQGIGGQGIGGQMISNGDIKSNFNNPTNFCNCTNFYNSTKK